MASTHTKISPRPYVPSVFAYWDTVSGQDLEKKLVIDVSIQI